MRTLLSQFCEEFEAAVQPLLDPLKGCADTLSNASDELEARQALPPLMDLRHQLQQLQEKVAGQQAYVLIFGPLKSGKSTLMNAVSSAYVSEVSCLPAYPCMVFVSHAENREFVLTRYNSQAETFTDPMTMRMHVTRAHTELAGRIRQVEKRDEEFDPSAHYPEAIRRIDVKLPARALAKSSAVLVDTPGLYSRMKFGYDRMTREFRNTAACAIFVVKTDNLFLEQVFQEFNELLELFSRIFLVVNLDTQKNDLKPDGTLAPSLEREDPVRIIEAFENLAMSAPLKAAAEDGRLRIYPVDLQRAAISRLQPEEDAGPTQTDFDRFVHDLEGYLNSTDYLVAFLGDSLRHAEHLMQEIHRLLDHSAIRELSRAVDGLETEKRRLKLQGEVLTRLSSHPWSQSFHQMEEELLRDSRERVQSLRKRSETSLRGALDDWFASDASLNSLAEDSIYPAMEECQRDLAGALHQALSERVARGAAGLEVPDSIARDLSSAEFQLGLIGRHSLIQLDSKGGRNKHTLEMDTDSIPVKKSFWDWVLFRSQGSMRKKMFGDGSPNQRIPASVKNKRLGDEARESLWAQVAQHLDGRVPEIVEQLSQQLFGEYSKTVLGSFNKELSDKRGGVEELLRGVDGRLREVQSISTHVEELKLALDSTRTKLTDLSASYGETDPNLLVQPLDESSQATGLSPEQLLEQSNGELEIEIADEQEAELPTVSLTPAAPPESEGSKRDLTEAGDDSSEAVSETAEDSETPAS